MTKRLLVTALGILLAFSFAGCANLPLDSNVKSLQRKFSQFPNMDLTKSSIDFDQILSGGPGKDGIPAINKPKFISVSETDIADDSLGIFLDLNGDKRFYPFDILVWHEIVNDVVGEEPVAITFCPLCGSAIVFDRTLDGEVLEFGVSGFLFESNLLMYDKQTESLWSQVLGEGVVGSYTGTELERVNMQRIPFQEVKEKHPDTGVLSKDTGYIRNYSVTAYGDYDTNDDIYFPVSIEDKRFHPKEIMLVVPLDNVWVAFPWNKLLEAEEASIEVNGATLSVTLNGSETDITYQGEPVPSYFEMWFSFATHHQDDGIVW